MQRGSNSSSSNNRMLVHPACASCKHQRKRCTENCALAPYFPAEKTLEFQAVHKVFGVSNVVKLVKDVIEERRKETVDSLVWEALCRQNDPVLGCYGKLKRLQEEFDLYRTQHPSLNQNQLGQHHGSVVYSNKQSPTMVNRKNNRGNGIAGGLTSNNMVSYDTEKLIFDSIQHSYHWNYVQSTLDKSKLERDASSLLILPSPPPPPLPQHHSFNGFNQQQYYLPGEFGSMDSTLFIGSEEDGP
ncbi:hypothetical protein SADUNF_Sadunf19G0092300 [Salix dunnii]|uniref:LOB domain-containing protein n=1 Tax=Salix dunnii TaxID=1413687 RepID=A0A835J224_9ROSI|nr:hypothetical protein SADUNF_Sadunf19G0092300 [Salix dunnii]